MSTTMEDAIRRNFAERGTAERPNSIESANLRQRSRRLPAAPAELQQARRFRQASVDARAMERQCILPAVSDVEYVPGRHGAALEERHWHDIADFVFGADPPTREASERRWWAVWLGHGAAVVWLVLMAIALVPVYALFVALGFPELSGWRGAAWWRQSSAVLPAWLWAIALMGWTRVLSLILLRL